MSAIDEPGDRSRWGFLEVGAARGSTELGEGADADRQASSGYLLPRSSGATAADAIELARSFDDLSDHGHQSGPRSFGFLEGRRPNFEIEADFQKSASWSQTGLAGTLASAVTIGAIEVYRHQTMLLNFHFGLQITQAAAIVLRLPVVYGLEGLYLPQGLPDVIQRHSSEVTIAASPI